MSLFVAANFIRHLECDLNVESSISNNLKDFLNVKNIYSLLNGKKNSGISFFAHLFFRLSQELIHFLLMIPECWFAQYRKEMYNTGWGTVVGKELVNIEAKHILLDAQLSK